MEPDNFEQSRRQMVEWQLRARNITDPDVLQAMAQIPRHRFIPEDGRHLAYEDRALPIGFDQTISQPYMVALMTEKLQVEPGLRVLEIGTGFGYQTAVLARLAREVFTVERLPELSLRAQEVLAQLGLLNIHFNIDDGTLGWPDHAPFDRILVTAGAPDLPTSLVDQLADGGLLVIPVGPEDAQTLLRVRKSGRELHREPIIACRFVKLFGRQGWSESDM